MKNLFNKIINSDIWMAEERAQMIIEYVVVFTVIVAAIIVAATALIRPSIDKLFTDTSESINKIGDKFVSDMSY
ncbi:MAG: hypothetical protein PHY56_01995 [Candidatus Omnitrophica bacterium]|nr:hypothetical protein [Candidatus Omnitrophota bacterium]